MSDDGIGLPSATTAIIAAWFVLAAYEVWIGAYISASLSAAVGVVVYAFTEARRYRQQAAEGDA